MVLRGRPPMTVDEIAAALVGRRYLARREEIEPLLHRFGDAFSVHQGDSELRWSAVGREFPGYGRGAPPAQPRGFTGGPQTSAEDVIATINHARSERGQAILDEAEARQVRANLARHAADPERYRNKCWNCDGFVDEATNEKCRDCRWLVCWCGACRSPDWEGPGGRQGVCRVGAWALAGVTPVPDYDFRGRAILTAQEPGADAAKIRAITGRHNIALLFHWSPARAIESILTHGILSPAELSRRGIDYVAHGYGSREKEAFLRNYVALSLRSKDRMMADWSTEPIVWGIDPEVLTCPGVLSLPDNSAKSDFAVEKVIGSVGAASYEAAVDAYRSRAGQVEFFVPARIPRMAIRRVFVPSAEIEGRVSAAASGSSWPRSSEQGWLRQLRLEPPA